MKKYKVSVSVGVYFYANSKEEAGEIWGDMAMSFTNPENGKEYDADIWDAEVIELDNK